MNGHRSLGGGIAAVLAVLAFGGAATCATGEEQPAATGVEAKAAEGGGEIKAAAAAPDAAATGAAETPAAEPAKSAINVKKLFAANCSWCHDGYGMHAGKGPALAGTLMTEKQVSERIRNGKEGAMPSFRKTLSDEQIAAFASYIKNLKPEN